MRRHSNSDLAAGSHQERLAELGPMTLQPLARQIETTLDLKIVSTTLERIDRPGLIVVKKGASADSFAMKRLDFSEPSSTT
jgi:hypothetical protein